MTESTAQKRINVELDHDFVLEVDLNSQKEEFDDRIIVDSVDFYIKGLGKGRVQICRVKMDDQSGLAVAWNNTNTPAGSFKVEFESKEGRLRALPESLPIGVILEIDDLTRGEIERLKVLMYMGGYELEGLPDWDVMEMNQRGRTKLAMHGWVAPLDRTWGDWGYSSLFPEVMFSNGLRFAIECIK